MARPALQRRIGLFSATALIVANMIGTGIFTTSGFIMQDLGSAGLLLAAWLVGGLFALTGALCYAELGVRLPRSGGEYAFLRESFGPLWGFLSGWISLIVGFSAPIAASAMAFAAYALPLWPDTWFSAMSLTIGGVTLCTISPQTVLALAVIAGLSLIHARSLVVGINLQNLLTCAKVIVIAAFVIAGFVVWAGRPSLALAPAASGVSFMSRDFAVALIYVSFAYSGWNAAAYLGGEIREPGRNLPRALIAGTVLVTVLYLLLNLLFVLVLTPGQMSGVVPVGSLAAQALMGPYGGRVFGAAIAFFLLSNAGAMILAGPRVYYAMAHDGFFFRGVARVDQRGHTPKAAVLLQAAIAALLVLAASFSWLLIYIGFTLSLFAMLTVLGLMVLRRRQPTAGTYRTPGYPFTALFFAGGNLWIIIHSLAAEPLVAAAALFTLLVGGLVYAWFKATSPHAISGPDRQDTVVHPTHHQP